MVRVQNRIFVSVMDGEELGEVPWEDPTVLTGLLC